MTWLAMASGRGPAAALRVWVVRRYGWLPLLALAIHVYAHAVAGLTVPVPWPDELHFLLPARSLWTEGSLHSQVLHPDRPAMWMPPGYAVLMAPVAGWGALDLTLARSVSLLAIAVAGAGLWRALRPAIAAPIVAIVVAAFWIHTSTVVAGNVARMEAVVLALVLWGFAMLPRRPWAAAGVLAASILVHPNGAYFAAAAAWWHLRHGSRPRPTRSEWVVIAIAALSWLAYAGHVVSHFDGFVADMTAQFHRKASRDLLAAWMDRRVALAVAMLVATRFCRNREGAVRVALLGTAAMLVNRVGHEMWYRVFDIVFFGCGIAIALQVAAEAGHVRHRVAGWLAVAVWLVALWPYRPSNPLSPSWSKMKVWPTPYVTAAEVAQVLGALPSYGAQGEARVEFFPRGDAIFFVDRPGLRIIDPVLHRGAVDVGVFHDAPWLPPHWRRKVQAAVQGAGTRARLVAQTHEGATWTIIVPGGGDADHAR